MPLATPWIPRVTAFVVLLAIAAPSSAQAPAPGASPAAPAPPPSPVQAIRNKLSAADLPSAESVLEVYRERNGEDGPWLNGLAWLARGALLTGDVAKAGQYADTVRARCATRLAKGAKLEDDHDAEIALGAAIEVQAQLAERRQGARRAAEFVRGELAKVSGPVALRSRLSKRLNMLALAGTPAPELVVEESLGPAAPTLASLRGKPVVLFLWAESCGDCKAQAASLARVKRKYADRGVQWLAVTRHYAEPADRAAESARADSVWKSVYADVGETPIVFSTASMERYGGSSTPTFVFVDPAGVVRGYTPTRLTESALDREVASLLR